MTSFSAYLLPHTYPPTLQDEHLLDLFSLILKISAMPRVGSQSDMVMTLAKIPEHFNEQLLP